LASLSAGFEKITGKPTELGGSAALLPDSEIGSEIDVDACSM
jgi:hypothetical protein